MTSTEASVSSRTSFAQRLNEKSMRVLGEQGHGSHVEERQVHSMMDGGQIVAVAESSRKHNGTQRFQGDESSGVVRVALMDQSGEHSKANND